MATQPLPTPTMTGETQPTVAVVETPTPQVAARQAIQDKYDSLYGGQPPVQQPTQVSQPATVPTVQAVPETESLQNQIAELKQQLATMALPPQAPQQPSPVEAAAVDTWESLLMAGKLKEAKELLLTEAQAAFAQQNSPRIIQEAVEAAEAKAKISGFLTNLRSQNPDLAPMEKYLSGPVNARMDLAQKEGKIKNAYDYADQYVAAVNAEWEDLRKVKQQYVGAGREEATIRQREVISSTPLPPNVVAQREPEAAAGTPEGTSVDPNTDYFAKRALAARALRNLS